jgi:membrane-bound lytic murein transglycosylase A
LVLFTKKNVLVSFMADAEPMAALRSFLLLIMLAGCAVPGPDQPESPAGTGLAPVAFATLPGWTANITMVTALQSFVRSCRVISVMPEDQILGGSGLTARLSGQAGSWRQVCAAGRMVPPGNAAAATGFFETYFAPYRVSAATKFSGYFEPVYDGSETRLPGYDVPVYGKPRDLVSVAAHKFGTVVSKPVIGRLRYQKLVPYYTRAQIDGGAISGQAPVVAWLRNRVDAYMMQVQGAGRLLLPDGTMIELGFDGTNGRTYVPIGKLMVARHLLAADDVNAQSISAWLKTHPSQAASVMDANRNYVFFKRVYDVPQHLGAPGALGVPLTPGASIAVADKAVPLGMPLYVSFVAPRNPRLRHHDPIDRIMVAQDIDAGAHDFSAAEIFTGIGGIAAAQAAGIAGYGQVYVLLPRPARTAAVQSQPAAKATP